MTNVPPSILPPLEDDEHFSHREWWDEDDEGEQEFAGVFVTLTKGCFKLERLISLDQVYYAKFDFLRHEIGTMLEELREGAQ